MAPYGGIKLKVQAESLVLVFLDLIWVGDGWGWQACCWPCSMAVGGSHGRCTCMFTDEYMHHNIKLSLGVFMKLAT